MTPVPHLSLGLLFTAAAGFADAIGFIVLGGHYVSFMSGNTTQLGDALAVGAWSTVLLASSLVVLFFAGSFTGSMVALRAGSRWGAASVTALVLASFAAALTVVALGRPPEVGLAIVAFGAGAQNAILVSTGSVRLGTTFVTGTLFSAGQDLARGLQGVAPRWRWLQHLLVWGSLMGGALLGGIAYRYWSIWSLIVPALLYAAFTVVFLVRPPQEVEL